MKLFNPPDIGEAHEKYGANCGPAAFAALVGKPILEIIHLFPQFPAKRWTNGGSMKSALAAYGVIFKRVSEFPKLGVAHMLIDGPWTGGRWAFHRSHWFAVNGHDIFDINSHAGWLQRPIWEAHILPDIIASYKGGTGWTFNYGLQCEYSTLQ
jgi:hypothetical protein